MAKFQKYLFSEKLIPALIKSRPNRFIMMVELDGKVEKCHCPSTGRIGNMEFKDVPCLLSKSNNSKRKTSYTVEAFSPARGKWVGINQTKVNTYLEFFFKHNLFPKMFSVKTLKREVKLLNSRIDFLINDNCYLEVKTPLIHLPFGNSTKKSGVFNSFERLVRHFKEISLQIKKGQRAIVVLCYLYDAKPFQVPDVSNNKIIRPVRRSTNRGLEHWQINLKIDSSGVSLLDYFPLKIF